MNKKLHFDEALRFVFPSRLSNLLSISMAGMKKKQYFLANKLIECKHELKITL